MKDEGLKREEFEGTKTCQSNCSTSLPSTESVTDVTMEIDKLINELITSMFAVKGHLTGKSPTESGQGSTSPDGLLSHVKAIRGNVYFIKSIFAEIKEAI